MNFHLFFLCRNQALQLGQDANSPYGIFNGQRCQMCLRSDPLHKVMERLANPGKICSLVMLVLICSLLILGFLSEYSMLSGVRRVIIVEAGSKRVEGIISLGDVFRFLLG